MKIQQKISHIKQQVKINIHKSFTYNASSSLNKTSHERVSNNITVTPKQYLQFVKARKEQMQYQYVSMLQANVKSKYVVERLQKDASISFNENLKLYGNKKFQLQQCKLKKHLQFMKTSRHSFLKSEVKQKILSSANSIQDRHEKHIQQLRNLQQSKGMYQQNLSESLFFSDSNQKYRRKQLRNMIKLERKSLSNSKQKRTIQSVKLGYSNHNEKLNRQKMFIKFLNKRYADLQENQ